MIRTITVLAVLVFALGAAQAKSVADYVEAAGAWQEQQKLDSAAAVMERAVAEHPDNAKAHAYLGLYLGMQAGQARDYAEAGRLVALSFESLDRAVELDSLDPDARYYRGLMGVQVPEFLGKLDNSVADLRFLLGVDDLPPAPLASDREADAWSLLAAGYQKQEKLDAARQAWEKVIELAPGTADAVRAREELVQLEEQIRTAPSAGELLPDDPEALEKLGREAIAASDYEAAATALRKATALDSLNLEAFILLARAVERQVAPGYDERIASDTDLRTNLAFELTRVLDHAVELAPDDIDLRFWRGVAGIHMPFFTGKLEPGIKDLEMVAASDADDHVKADALYYLGVGYQRKATDYWIRVVSKYGKTEAATSVLRALSPGVKRFDPAEHDKPVVAIDLILGLQDQLQPQTAIWIEDGKGGYVATVYVSGFSGHAKGAQVDLPRWARASEYKGCDAVTGASIDLGHHIYTWDLTDWQGRTVGQGTYVVKVECSWWPSMQYERAEVEIQVGNKPGRVRAEDGSFIPFLEAAYYPK